MMAQEVFPGLLMERGLLEANYSGTELQQIGLSFKNDWNTEAVNAPINGSLKFSVGDKFDFNNDVFGYMASLDYSSATSNIVREKNFYDYSGPRYQYDGVTYANGVMLSGLLNLRLQIWWLQ